MFFYSLVFLLSHEYGNNKKQIASRGRWHYYGKSVWKNPKNPEGVHAEKDTRIEVLLADPFSVAWKRKTVTKLTPVVGHMPREISGQLAKKCPLLSD